MRQGGITNKGIWGTHGREAWLGLDEERERISLNTHRVFSSHWILSLFLDKTLKGSNVGLSSDWSISICLTYASVSFRSCEEAEGPRHQICGPAILSLFGHFRISQIVGRLEGCMCVCNIQSPHLLSNSAVLALISPLPFLYFFFQDLVSLCSPGWCYVHNPLALASLLTYSWALFRSSESSLKC